jgi:carlactone synthase/all-trans-10'-apo-beta-carotenal 13,14-cleaving dioxygenase
MPSSYLVDPSDLSTSRQVVYTDGVKGDLTTAHPKLLPDGTLINFSRWAPVGMR